VQAIWLDVGRQPSDLISKVGSIKGIPQRFIVVLFKRVDIRTHRPRKEHGILHEMVDVNTDSAHSFVD
jgi:hypothetical protein